MKSSHHHCSGSSGCDSHGDYYEEYDPCMAQEVACAEKERVLYDKLKSQSDRFLLGLNIRIDQGRVRGPAAQEEDEPYSPCSHETDAHQNVNRTKLVSPMGWGDFAKVHAGKRVIVLVSPCDVSQASKDQDGEASFHSIVSIREQLEGIKISNPDVVLAEFSLPVCVCGKCENPDMKLTGSLRSVMLLLRKNPSVLVVRSGGLVGMWTQADGPLASFISKHF